MKSTLFSSKRSGFAIIVSMVMLVLLVTLAVSILILNQNEAKKSLTVDHTSIARANARLALNIALNELQVNAGPDQRVTARAAILEDPDGNDTLANRNWVGVWKTTFEDDGREWPLIGQDAEGSSTPYPHRNLYSDLRQQIPALQGSGRYGPQWREQLLQTWLVSHRGEQASPEAALDPNDTDRVVEILGKGTLGQNLKAEYEQERALVEKIEISDSGSGVSGSYAWIVFDENQKASINLDPELATTAHSDNQNLLRFLATQSDNPKLVDSTQGNSFADYLEKVGSTDNWSKILSYSSAALAADDTDLSQALGENFNHLTSNGSGLFTDTAQGGLRRDLSPLLFGNTRDDSIIFPSPSSQVADFEFNSDSPIIPGPRKAAFGPNFDALRFWGRMRDQIKSNGRIDAQTQHRNPGLTTFQRDGAGWNVEAPSNPRKTDGVTFRGDTWASSAPKIHPIIADARWHFYFSHFGTGNSQNIRSHIIPRVLLWNPYNVPMDTQELVVLMANPFPNSGSLNPMRAAFALDPSISDPTEKLKWQGAVSDPIYGFDNVTHGLLLNFRGDGTNSGLLPQSIYLGFVLEATTIDPGECLVFSPSMQRAGQTRNVGSFTIKRYDESNIWNNVLSPSIVPAREPGENHFFHDNGLGILFSGDTGLTPRTTPDQVRLDDLIDYGFFTPYSGNRPFILKGTPGGNWNHSVGDIVGAPGVPALATFPTLQLIDNGASGPSTGGFPDLYSAVIGSAKGSNPSFGDVNSFLAFPSKDAPSNHQFGVKLLTLDESLNEASERHIRQPHYKIRDKWGADHIAYNPASVANWNIRPGLVTRSPSNTVYDDQHAVSQGAYIYQYLPESPQSSIYTTNAAGNYARSPFLQSKNYSAALFDLPNEQFGALSLGSLRHAQLSPYSFHPSYIVGSSLADLHAPYEHSANLILENPQPYQNMGQNSVPTGYDNLLGAGTNFGLPKTEESTAGNLFPVGNDIDPVNRPLGRKTVEGERLTSKDEILTYDIAFEVNQNLWDKYFISGMPISGDRGFIWNQASNQTSNLILWNGRYALNDNADTSQAESQIQGADGLTFGFWNNAYLFKNRGAFNVNSTSVKAWTAFLSGHLGIPRETRAGRSVGGANEAVFSRVLTPEGSADTSDARINNQRAWLGGRTLSSAEIETLAENIVAEVKRRGPFISLADFINRRLAPRDSSLDRLEDPCLRGALEAAILRANLNDNSYPTRSNLNQDNTVPAFTIEPDKQPLSKAWGMPGHLTQGDILDPIAPAITVRGDSFVIRTYGESRDAAGNIVATAYLEAVVERSPDYEESSSIYGPVTGSSGNHPAAPAVKTRRASARLIEGDLVPANQQRGRRFIIKTTRWLNSNEV